MDHEFDGDWRTLFDVPGDRLRSVFLGDPHRPTPGSSSWSRSPGTSPAPSAAPTPAPPRPGFFLLSFFVDVDVTLKRLAAVGLDEPSWRIKIPAPGGDVDMVTLRDPDGVIVELVGIGS